MSQFGLSGGIPWLRDSDGGAFCFVCKQDVESVTHFLLDCSYFKQNFRSLWRNLKLKSVSNQADGVNTCQFIDNLDRHHKAVLLLVLPLFTIRQCNKYVNQEIWRFIARGGGGGRLPNEGRYGCAASAKPRPGKIFPKNNTRAKNAQKPNYRAKFSQKTQCPGKKCPKT